AAFQTHYRLTAVYQVSVVLIESDRPARSALPVRERRVFVEPFKRPVINTVEPQLVTLQNSLRIQGYNLRADNMTVRINGDPPSEVVPTSVTDSDILFEPPNTLSAGVKTLQIVHYRDVDPDETVQDLRTGPESNTVAFILRPTIVAIAPDPVAINTTLTLSVDTPVDEGQRATLLLNDQAISASAFVGPLPTTTIEFNIPAEIAPGSYLVRLRIDGAESELEPATGPYTGPTVTVTA
ncbi:MAG: hypothetical protein AAFR58_18035, partial [Cyanobacteria bacterium J06627_28]